MNNKILIAEDDSAILEVIRIILEGEGYSIITTDEKDDIFNLISQHNPVLILIDIWLAGHDGGKIAKKIKSTSETKHIPVVMISANNETAKITKESGADDYLLKPFDIEDLLKIIKKHIKK
jgi:DNA-binding response OmpR family regulator